MYYICNFVVLYYTAYLQCFLFFPSLVVMASKPSCICRYLLYNFYWDNWDWLLETGCYQFGGTL